MHFDLKIYFSAYFTILYPNLQKKNMNLRYFRKKLKKVENSTFRDNSNKKSGELEKSNFFLHFVCKMSWFIFCTEKKWINRKRFLALTRPYLRDFRILFKKYQFNLWFGYSVNVVRVSYVDF
jgi:hypothetical protein